MEGRFYTSFILPHYRVVVQCILWTFLLLVKHGTAEENQVFSLEEGLPAGTVVGKIGSECDRPEFDIYPYKSGYEDDLSVDKYTGEILTKKVLDRETKDQYQFVAVTTNHCQASDGQIAVLINVNDINDHAPTFPESVKQLQLSESSPRDAKYPLGSATDPDLGINSTQRYEIVSGNTNNTFRLGEKRSPNGILYLDLAINGALDYEITPSYNLVIRAYDGQGRYGEMRVNVIISDVNDNQPIFNQTRYSARVPENATVGTPVAQVYATDQDSNENGRVEYYIDRQRSDPGEKFDINPNTGMIYVNKDLDYETKSSYDLIVVARDNGSLRSQTTAVVSILLLDVNDNEPTISLIFLTNDGTAKISETAEPGDYVARISVNDPDLTGSNYAHVNVTLNGGDGRFGLTTRDNVVYLVILAKPLDREEKPFYQMTIVATDSGTPPLKAEQAIRVVVTDANDNPPRFTTSTYYADIQEVVPVGSSVIVVTARDSDEGDNSRLMYRLVNTPGTRSDWFRIDNRTGLITTARRVDCETSASPRLTVVATDGGLPPLSATATVIVRIQDVNDNQPVFDQSFYNVSVPEDKNVGSCVLKVSLPRWTGRCQVCTPTQVVASDPDCGGSAALTYLIALNRGFDHPRHFEINNRTGDICVVRPLDYEAKHTYEFPVIARDQDGLETTAMVKISLRDVNDNVPSFDPGQYNVNLQEDAAPGSDVVVVVRATDPDSGQYSQVTYSISGGNNGNVFTIDANSGEIRLSRRLPAYPRQYRLTVTARDGGGRAALTAANVSVSVLNADQRPPRFTRQLYTFDVGEDVAPRSRVGQVLAENTDPGAGSIRYSIVSGNQGGYFSLDPETGEITTRRGLDYDDASVSLLNIQAESGSPPSYGQAQVRITVNDVNDNAPEFEVSSVEIPVKENTAVGSILYVAQAVDRDGGENGRITYLLQAGNGYFTIDGRSGAVKLAKQLDYEGQKRHEVTVVAQDNGVVSQKMSLSLVIVVKDVNDNAPVFRQASYSVTIIETILPNTKFIQVNATDKDTGNNARITYMLQNGPHVDKFGIFPNGYLYNRVNLDRESEEQYVLRIIAMDSGIPPLSSTTEVRVQVLDANDNSPIFQEEAYVFHVEENQPAGTRVGMVAAIDRDQTDSLRLQYKLSGPSEYFSIAADTGVLSTKRFLDQEQQDVYHLSVQVSDGGSPPLTSSVNVKVQVLDQNDNTPTFDHQGAYEATVDENQPKGTVVTQVSARDLDKGENGSVTYHFAEGEKEAEVFTIHARTGQITTREVLDHEKQSMYRFKVFARDGGQPPRETYKTVVVTVNDINESPPLFEKKEITFYVDENIAPGTVIGNVKANDTDSGENGRVVYYLIEGNLFGIFKLNQTTGSIIVSKPVDYEISSSYTLIIRALDNSVVNPMSSSIVVHIQVRDKNDNAPVFEQDPVLVSVRENEAPDSPVYTFSASDPDSGPQGTVHYSIVSQAPGDQTWFTIDVASGVLRVATPLDYEQVKQITVQVQATDQPTGGFSPLSTTVTALIMVQDVNDNKPVFTTRSQLDLLEDEPVGYPIEHLLATDADSKENGRVSYAIISGNEKGHFRIDSNTGLLSIARSLDRESKQAFRLNVTARDHGYPQMASFMTLTVNVIDVNDNPPVFTHSVYNATVAENLPIKSFVTKIQATDPDTGKNAELQYLIPYGIADNHFMIGKTSGTIETNATLDREQRSDWVITAYVKDSAFPALYDTATVRVKVVDANDNAPAFMQARYDLVVPENAPQTVIHTVVARDADEGDNGRITYSIIEGNEDKRFILNPTTGELSCRPLDREEGSEYTLTVLAADAGRPPQSAYATLVISVLDENDNNPVFRRSVYDVTIPENATVGTEVVAVTADDADEGLNAQIVYSISNATEGLFKINNRTGMITTSGEFDREKKSSYTFEVDATDGGQYGPRSKKVRVTVHVSDINDNAPVFEQIPYKASISASHSVRQYVVQVSATDKDEGPNGQITYSLARTSQYFEINRDSGTIITKALLDPGALGVHTLAVIARDKGSRSQSATGLVEIKVGNAPGLSTLRFTNLTYNVYLPENSPTGTPVTTVTARFTSGASGAITYSFTSSNEDDTFNIHPTTGSITVSSPRKLDFETNSRLRLIVVATSDTAYGYTTVWVNLRDVNDNAPRFTQDRYISSVFEGNKDGTYVTQVSASDDDSGQNGQITYFIIGGNIENAFVIDPPNTGIVKTNFILDREIHATYRLEIEAVDGGVPPRTSRCTLKISVNDINDNAPFFPSYPVKNLNEGQELGTLVLQVTANDKDLNPVLRYDFARNGNPGSAFSIDRYSGRITVVKELDYEKKSRYLLQVKATDGAYNATTNVTVQIVDQNDNTPEFSQLVYQVTLPELTGPDQPVVTVNATDRDDGENARLTYSIFTERPFRIDPQTGTIYTKERITFNPAERDISLVVKAQDHGNPSLFQVVPVRLQVRDVNNNAPIFDQSSYSADVQEDAQQAVTVLTVAASDRDFSHNNSKVDFSIVSGNEQDMFQITSTGEVLLVGDLDYEQATSYNLVVMAKDRGQPPLNSTVSVKITVLDVNDNVPIFGQSTYAVVVNESVEVGTTVVKVQATDGDTGENAVIRYFINSGNDFDNFRINRQTGVITVTKKLDYERTPSHRLVVRAEDSSTKFSRQLAFTTVMVNVSDVNEFSPHFPVMMYLESVREDQPVDTVVFTAHANDKDGGEYGVVRYSIRDSQKRFTIDPVTGVVSAITTFQYGDKDNYRFDIIATDKAGKYDDVPVSVRILPKVESLPQFTKRVYDFVVPGNATVGYEVGRVTAINQEDGQAGRVEYYFKEENDYFAIEKLSGLIFVTRNLQDQGQARRRRFVARYGDPPVHRRERRALEQDQVDLTVVASSSLPSLQGKAVEAKVSLAVDRQCLGCQSAAAQQGDFSGTVLVIVIVFIIVAVIVGVALIIVYLRNRDRKRRPPDQHFDSSYDASEAGYPPAPIRDLPPTYNEIQHFPSARHHGRSNHTLTTSEISEQSHSASSGRGSAEDGEDVDEEIRMINETPLEAQTVRMPDSGIQQDDDTLSEHSVQNHHEYLARLGIDSTKLNTKAPPPGFKQGPPPVPPHPAAHKKAAMGSSVESMHQFSDEGGGEGVGLDLPSLVYSKLTEVASEENMAIMDGTRRFRHGETTTEPSHAGSLSSVINSEEEFSGSYNWDYLLDWGPQYQPLAHVFAEIARLKDDSIKPKKQPTQIVPQRPNLTALNSQAVNKTGPPPLLTNAPPMAVMAQPVSARPKAQHGSASSASSSSGASSSVAVHSARTTAQLTSLPSLPRSPISHESSYTSPALTPSFTPSLSPLATRSPSISPLATPKAMSSSGQSSSGPNTPQRQRHLNTHITLTNTGSSESEQEIRI